MSPMKTIVAAMLLAAAIPAQSQDTRIFLADPTIFVHGGTYYFFGTGSSEGFPYYSSSDLKTWTQPADSTKQLALKRGETFGNTGFWAPQVFQRGDSFYMAYTANEQIAIARAPHPSGPFRQDAPLRLSGSGKQIDPFVYFDESGKVYLYHVKLQQGNRIFVSEMKPDLSDVIPGTEMECVAAGAGWENTAGAEWPVAEGPTVLRHKNLYYLIYSANDFRNKDYAVGYATAPSPIGPWKKYEGNPIVSRQMVQQNGTGHGDVLIENKGHMHYILHIHHSANKVSPRATAVIGLRFRPGKDGADVLEADLKSFRTLTINP